MTALANRPPRARRADCRLAFPRESVGQMRQGVEPWWWHPSPRYPSRSSADFYVAASCRQRWARPFLSGVGGRSSGGVRRRCRGRGAAARGVRSGGRTPPLWYVGQAIRRRHTAAPDREIMPSRGLRGGFWTATDAAVGLDAVRMNDSDATSPTCRPRRTEGEDVPVRPARRRA
jgi:hypothetical protein